MKDALRVPKYVLTVNSLLSASNYESYLVGGSVRDALMGREPQDWDITTNATPDQIQEVFGEGSFYDNSFGTVGVVVKIKDDSEDGFRNEVVHVTTYRSEGEYSDFRRPDAVEWGKTIRDDLQRRDFTINAIGLKIISNSKAELKDLVEPIYSLADMVSLGIGDYTIVDPYGGLVDLQKGVIRAVGEALERFHEDALRMLRAVRFHSQLGFSIESATFEAVVEKSENITRISGERIRDELWKILKSERAYEGFVMLNEVGLLKYILPELVAGRGLDQRGHHLFDVFDHSMNALKHCPSSDPIVRFAALLHDVGKPVTHEVRDGINTFYNHDIVGSKLVNQISYRLHLSKKEREKLYTLVRFHMFTVDTIQTDAAVRRFIRKVGVENIADMVDLRIGDRLGSGTKDAEGWRLKEFKKRIENLLMPTFTVKDLVIDGNDVMRILNIKPGRQIGEILNQLFEEVLDEPEKNTKEYLEKRVLELKS
jgi:tRNA nucleotidyltransferase (CCA-adding enzyme)